MTNQSLARFLALSLGLSLTTALPSQAATYSWDASLTPATASGGTGTWDLSTANWSNGTTDQAWTDTTGSSDIASLGGTAGTVTLGTSLGANGLVFTTTGYTIATGANTLTLGSSGIDASALSSGTTTLTGLIALAASQSWNVGSGAVLTSSAVISGTGYSITKTGSGTLTLSGADTFTGGVNLNAGTLLLGNAAGAGTGTLTLNGGTLGATGALSIANAVVAATGTTTNIAGSSSAATLTVTGTLSGSGTIVVGNGSGGLQLQTTAFPSSGFTGTIQVAEGSTTTTGLLFGPATSGNNNSGTYNMSQGTLTFSGTGTAATVGWNASGGGGTNSNGTIMLGALSSASGVGQLNNGFGGNNKRGSYIIGYLNTSTTYGGILVQNAYGSSAGTNGTTNLSKVGSGTLTLSGAAASNTMTGGITVREGTLQIGDGSTTAGGFSTASNALTFVGAGGTFNYVKLSRRAAARAWRRSPPARVQIRCSPPITGRAARA
ncbi:MAG: autotransporter-associated beta strand repeat-containing protein [Chthoniobacteraceae bacterium]